jgi:hypothetical protein
MNGDRCRFDTKHAALPIVMHMNPIADRRVLLVTSANLTQSGVTKNIEAGLVIRGGTVPVRAAEHIAELQAGGTLVRLL